jgi:hypothetical protein
MMNACHAISRPVKQRVMSRQSFVKAPASAANPDARMTAIMLWPIGRPRASRGASSDPKMVSPPLTDSASPMVTSSRCCSSRST